MLRLGVVLSLVLLGCTPTPGPNNPIAGANPDGSPKWVNRGSGAFDGEHGKCFYGVGLLKGVRNEALARQAADNRARGEVAKLFDLYIAAMMKDYQRSTTAGNFKASAEEQDIVSAQKTITEVTLRGVEIRDHWIHPQTGVYYALAVLDVDGVAKSLETARQLNATVRDFVRHNARRAFEDMDRELDARRSDHPKLPTCADGAQLTYVIDDQAQIRTFHPTSPTPLQLKGTLSCPLAGRPFSMAVRHDGIAFVLFAHSPRPNDCAGLARVDLKTLSCEKVSGFTCQSGALQLFGMGYALVGASGEETLLIAGHRSPTLAKLDPESGTVTVVGTAPSHSLELTGNPKGELWGFGPDPTARAFRMDSSTGAGQQTFPLAIPVRTPGNASWAFAEWGRVFYVFYGEKGVDGTSVYRLTPDGKLSTFLGKTGLNIVGAGNAVCAGI
jgi:hypothetical protein